MNGNFWEIHDLLPGLQGTEMGRREIGTLCRSRINNTALTSWGCVMKMRLMPQRGVSTEPSGVLRKWDVPKQQCWEG